jgi:hypothetical protein
LVSINFLSKDFKLLGNSVKEFFGWFRGSSSLRFIGQHNVFRVKGIFKVLVRDFNSGLNHMLFAGGKVIEIFACTVEFSNKRSNNMVGLSERDIMVSDKVVGNFSGSGEVFSG